MASNWYALSELAGLPGVPGTPQKVRLKAKREQWESRRRSGRGGGLEYAFQSLPVETQAAILASEAGPASTASAKPTKGPADRESLWSTYDRKPQTLKDRAERRLKALLAVEAIIASGGKKTVAAEQVAATFGESRATIYRWQKLVAGADRSDWLALLVPSYTGRTARAEISEEAWQYFKAQFLRAEAPTVATCYHWTKEAAKTHGWKLPSERTFQRRVREIPASIRVLARGSEEELMATQPSIQRSVANIHALQWINGDGYKHNVFVRFPDGTIDRPKTWFWQDVRSRMIVGFRTDRTEHSDVIRLSLGDVINRFGIPEHATIDNTRAAANKWLTGGIKNRYRFKVREEDPDGIMKQLGIQVHWTSVLDGKGHGQAKPIERAFGQGGLGEYCDKRYELRGAYTGPNPSEKPDNYGSKAIDFDQFVAVLADAVRQWNEKEGRRTEVCAGRLSYKAAFEESYRASGHMIRRATAAQQRLWMLMAEAVTVHRDSSIQLSISAGPDGRNRYGSDGLIDYIGRKVVVRFDPARLHEEVHVYQLDGRYIGPADCIHAAGFGDTGAAREWARNRKAKIRATKDQLASEKRMTALEAERYTPQPTPEETQPMQTDVTRLAFSKQKKVAGSDISSNDEPSAADKYGWNDLMVANLENLKKGI